MDHIQDMPGIDKGNRGMAGFFLLPRLEQGWMRYEPASHGKAGKAEHA